MSTITQTYTRTDIRKVFENFQADLQMLALRTQAMTVDHAQKCAYDICLMALEQCLRYVHVQLRDSHGNLVRVHRYSVKDDILSDSQRPGGNRWPCLPGGTLWVLIEDSDNQKLEALKRSGRLKINWGPSYWSTNYSGMRNDGARLYSSNSYGLRRDTFVT